MITYVKKSQEQIAQEIENHKKTTLIAKYQEIQKYYFDEVANKVVSKEEQLFQ